MTTENTAANQEFMTPQEPGNAPEIPSVLGKMQEQVQENLLRSRASIHATNELAKTLQRQYWHELGVADALAAVTQALAAPAPPAR